MEQNQARPFLVVDGLNQLTPDANYTGYNNTNDKSDYDNIVQDDTRSMPTQEDCTNAAINIYRRRIAAEINEITASHICYGFRFSLAPDVEIWSDQEQQFDILVLVNKKDSGQIPYPYHLKASENEDSSTNYILIPSSDALGLLEYEFFVQVATKLGEGRAIKDSLQHMTLEELMVFEDTRPLYIRHLGSLNN